MSSKLTVLYRSRVVALIRPFVRAIEANRLWVNPAAWSVLALLSTCAFILCAPGRDGNPVIIITTALAMMLFTSIGMILNVCYLPIDGRFLGRLILLYVSLVILFAVGYFLLVVFDDHGNIPFAGIEPAWTWLGGRDGREIRPGRAFETFVDCFHFSCVTMSTVGYGDMHPTTWYSKLFVDLQLMMGFAVVVVGLGRFFSRRT